MPTKAKLLTTNEPALNEILQPYILQIISAFTSGRVIVGAQLWDEIIAEYPNAEILRKIAFEMTAAEARAEFVKAYPLAGAMPGLTNIIAKFQYEMRRKRNLGGAKQ